MKRGYVVVFLAASALISTVVGAAISVFHNGTNCSVYQDGVLIYHLQCNANQTASCSYNNGQINMICQDNGSR